MAPAVMPSLCASRRCRADSAALTPPHLASQLLTACYFTLPIDTLRDLGVALALTSAE
jgi:hypothetical protein